MKKIMALLLAATASGAAWANPSQYVQLYQHSGTYTETIDGIAWQYCISNAESRIINATTLAGSYYTWYEYDELLPTYVSYSSWLSRLRSGTPYDAQYHYQYDNGWGNRHAYSYYHSAIDSSTAGAVVIPSTLGGCQVVAVDHYALGCCAGVTQVTIPEGVREIGPGAFYHCTGLTVVNLPKNLTKIDTCAFDSCIKLAKVTIPTTVKTVGDYAFRNCTALADVTIPNGVEKIDSYAFAGCTKLERVVLPMSVGIVNDYAFNGCTRLATVVLPEGIGTIAGGAFKGCSKLTSACVPSSVTNIGNSVFASCSSLKNVSINASVTTISDSMFSDCSALQSVFVPDAVESIGTSAFLGCKSLTTIDMPNNLVIIGLSAFQGCSMLTDVKIPSGVTKIQDRAFQQCTKLIGIDFPDGLLSIGSYAFYNCTSLTHADIPNTVTLINANAFVGCTGLERITLPGSINTMASGAFNCPNATVIFEGGVPNYSVSDAGLLKSKAISYPREYGAAWQKVLGTAQFGGYTQTQEEVPEVTIVSAQMRPTDSTILDVVYRVASKDAKVHVRVLAFENGVRSFANVIRPVTFVDDTGSSVGDDVTANENHTISWRVSADWKTDLSKMKFEVLAMRNNYVPLELITIPAIEGHDAMTITWNSLSPAQIVNALYWIYADQDESFVVTDGVLKQNGTTLMNGATLSNSGAAVAYIYSKMGYSVLSGDDLTYARTATRLPLADDANCPFAKKND